MAKSNDPNDDDESVNDSSYLRSESGDKCSSQIDYKYATKGPQIKAAIAGICSREIRKYLSNLSSIFIE